MWSLSLAHVSGSTFIVLVQHSSHENFAGAVAWVHGLMERIQEPMSKLQGMHNSVLESPDARDIQHTYDTLMAAMQEYESIIVQDWCKQVCCHVGA